MKNIIFRGCQQIIKIPMKTMKLDEPKLIDGPNSICEISKLIDHIKGKKALLVTDLNLIESGLCQKVFAILRENNNDFVTFSNILPNPTDQMVYEGHKVYKQSNCDYIIAFGGGSVMDTAKAIAALVANPEKDLEKLYGLLKVRNKVPNIIFVPTTSGTGSETTAVSVITKSQSKHKVLLFDNAIMPRYAILDPTLTVTMDPWLTATTGMDALVHAVEAYTNHTYCTAKENTLALKAISLIVGNIVTAAKEPENLSARTNMQYGAYYAGLAFTRGIVGNVHAIGHTLSGMYDTPHGETMAILLPHVLKKYGSACYQRLSEITDYLQLTDQNNRLYETVVDKAKAFIDLVIDLKLQLGIPNKPKNLLEEDIDTLAKFAYKEAVPLYPTPVIFSLNDYKEILRSLL